MRRRSHWTGWVTMTLLVALVALQAAGLERPAARTSDALGAWLEGPARAVEAIGVALDGLVAWIGLGPAAEDSGAPTAKTETSTQQEPPSTSSEIGCEADPWGAAFGCEPDPWGAEFGCEADPWG